MNVKRIVIIGGLLISTGCGVKGDPIPPGTPAELGRGRPTYKGATQEFANPHIPPLPRSEESEEEEENEILPYPSKPPRKGH